MMGLAKIESMPNGDLLVTRDGHQWRRRSGRWEMLGNSGSWFECDIQYPDTIRQVEDYECCLRPYGFEDGPDYPKGRHKAESVADFIRRLQVAELRKGAKNIFAPVPLHYTPGVDHVASRAAHTRRLGSPMPWRNQRYIDAAYAAAMYGKRSSISAESD